MTIFLIILGISILFSGIFCYSAILLNSNLASDEERRLDDEEQWNQLTKLEC